MGVLMIWPTARSTALAGAMTGLADEADATYYNPAGLAFQTTARADLTYASWLPGLYPGMHYASAAGGGPLRLPFLRGRRAFVAGSLACITLGAMNIYDRSGRLFGRVNPRRGAAGVHAAATLSDNIAVGLGAKLLTSRDAIPPWPYLSQSPFRGPAFGLEHGGTCTDVAFDVGMLYRPTEKISLGVAISNIGPDVTYYPRLPGEVESYCAALPLMAKAGLAWTLVENHHLGLRVMPELTKVLSGALRDTTGTKTFGRKLGDEWKDAWKALGIEATAFNLVSLRLGYFEDVTNQRGGIVLEKEGQTYHYGFWDTVTRKDLGSLEGIGLCWGFGLGTDKLRFDISSDAAIYDFPTTNWKFSLVANDIAGGIRELKQGASLGRSET
jgi:hypothetical protein